MVGVEGVVGVEGGGERMENERMVLKKKRRGGGVKVEV